MHSYAGLNSLIYTSLAKKRYAGNVKITTSLAN